MLLRLMRITVRPWSSLPESRSCWQCGSQINSRGEMYFCKCGKIQPPVTNSSYFDVFGIAETFEIDVDQVSKTFRSMQMRLHPDRFATRSPKEIAFAEEQSSLLNKAYSTLQTPLSRAEYLLRLNNVAVEEHDAVAGHQSAEMDEFLQLIMDVNERLADCDSLHDVRLIDNENSDKISLIVGRLGKAFAAKDFALARQLTIRLRYHLNIHRKIKEFERNQFG